MRVLIGYDGSAFSDAIFHDLHRAGLPSNVEAIVLCVADTWLPPGAQANDPRVSRHVAGLVEEARELAAKGAARLRSEFPSWSVKAETVSDSPAWALIKHGEGLEGPGAADLVVVGAAGRSAVGRFVFGSVAQRVLTYSKRSVRVARAASGGSVANQVRLIIGVDGSGDADHAVSAVAARVWPAGTQCRMVIAADEATCATFPEMSEDALSEHANRHVQELKAAGLEVAFHCRTGSSHRVLIQEAEQFQADCIFVGVRGLNRIDRFLVGSTSFNVAMNASSSVEIVRSGT